MKINLFTRMSDNIVHTFQLFNVYLSMYVHEQNIHTSFYVIKHQLCLVPSPPPQHLLNILLNASNNKSVLSFNRFNRKHVYCY